MPVVPMRTRGRIGAPVAKRTARVYAIAYDLNTEAAARHNAWDKIARVLGQHGFHRQQGTVFYGTEQTSAMTCAAAVLEMNDRFPWFWEVVRYMRMLRIDEEDDVLAIVPNRLRFDSEKVA